MAANTTPIDQRKRLAPAIIAAILALAVYVFLLDRWQSSAPTPATEAPATPAETTARLQMSRELSAPTGRPTTIANGPSTPGILPLLAFVLPLGAGILLGRAVAGRRPDNDTTAAEPRLPVPEPAGQAIEAPLSSTAIGTQPLADSAPPPAESDEHHHDELRGKDELIASLEAIVHDNRDRWSRQDQRREQDAARILELETELAAADGVIAHMEAEFAALRDPTTVHAKPQFVARG